jgi:asparagine synthase (glutamine-hydrolysing)
MCGIAGSIIITQPNVDLKRSLDAVIGKLNHRGPDHQKTLNLGVVQLAHARLSIIDTDQHANQPMLSEDQNYCLVFNGEIYNYIELRDELKSLGVIFTTSSDTEVLLKAWQQWQETCLEKLVGMFAFAIWDKAHKTLFLARDRMGEKPLYYHCQHGLIFASELNALLKHPLVENKINYQAVNHFLSLNYILTNECMIKDVHKLPPAHYLVYKAGESPRQVCYWDLANQFNKRKIGTSFNDSQQQYLSLYDKAVSRQLRSDVELGAYLSGGLDSSSIVASMLQSVDTDNIHTFSIDFKQQSFSELEFSKAVANHLQVQHRTQQVDIDNYQQILTAMSAFGEPFADTSLIPCYYLAKFSKQYITVALSGDGGDELFAGYETYAADRYRRLLTFLPTPIKRAALGIVNRHMHSSFDKVSLDYKLKQFLRGLNYDYQRAHYSWREIFSENEKQKLCKPDLLNQFGDDPYESYKKHFAPVNDCHWLDQSCYVDIKTWLVDDILVKVDRSSMAHSLEVRSPFLDHNIVEFSARLPHHWKLKSREKKHFLKVSQEKRLPRDIIYRKKSGFNAPIAHWLVNPSMRSHFEKLLFSDGICELFHEDYLRKIWIDHQGKTKDNSLKIFGLLSLSNWLTSHAMSM